MIFTTLAKSLRIYFIGLILGVLTPHFVFAAGLGGSFRQIVLTIVGVLSKTIMPLLIALAVLVMFGNIIAYIYYADNEKEQEKFKGYISWALIALFVSLALFGILNAFSGAIFGTSIAIPTFPTQ